jgi:hypothetical protein
VFSRGSQPLLKRPSTCLDRPQDPDRRDESSGAGVGLPDGGKTGIAIGRDGNKADFDGRINRARQIRDAGVKSVVLSVVIGRATDRESSATTEMTTETVRRNRRAVMQSRQRRKRARTRRRRNRLPHLLNLWFVLLL